MDIAKRLRKYMDYLGMPSTQFADEAKVSRPTISQILNGRNRKVSNELIGKLHEAFPRLNIMWLLFGDGDIEIGPNIETSEAKNATETSSATAQTPIKETDANDTRQNQPVNIPLQFSDIDEFIESSAIDKRQQATNAGRGSAISQPANQDNARKIKTIMVFYTDNSYEIFKPSV